MMTKGESTNQVTETLSVRYTRTCEVA